MLTKFQPPPPRGPHGLHQLLGKVLLPVASGEDAEATCDAVLPAVQQATGSITAVHIINTSGGWPDMAPREYRHEIADDALDYVRRRAGQHGVRAETRVIFDNEVTQAILRVADEIDATAIVFTPRGSGRFRSLFSNGVAWTLVKKATRPVIVFPAVEA